MRAPRLPRSPAPIRPSAHARLVALVVLAVLVGCRSTGPSDGCRPVRICSFNVYQLGLHPETRDLPALAEQLGRCDAVAVQEVRTDGDPRQLVRLAALGRPPWTARLSPPAGARERFGLLSRAPIEVDGEFEPLPVEGRFARRPQAIRLRAHGVPLRLAQVHAIWSDLERRDREAEAIATWMAEAGADPPVILLGDFNRFGGGGDGFTPISEAAARLGWRIPLETLGGGPGAPRAEHDAASTTVGREHWQYDQIVLGPGVAEALPSPARLGQEVGVIAFDLQPPWRSMRHEALRVAMSDHRPIWVELCAEAIDPGG